MYEEQTFIGVIAVTQVCCEPALQSSTEQRGLHFLVKASLLFALVEHMLPTVHV